MVDNRHRTVGLLAIPVELRLHIYGYLLPLDIDCGGLRGLVLSCRTIKGEVYHEMGGNVQKVRDKLQARWPFDQAFNIPFPGLAFKTKQLVAEVPYFSNGQVYNIQADMIRDKHERLQEFIQQGAFDLGARCVVLHIQPPEAVQTTATIPFYRVPPPRPGARVEKKEAPLLLKLYMRLSLSGSVHKKLPEQMSVVLHVREYASCPDAMVARVVELQRGPGDKLFLIESLREPAYAGTWPVLPV